MQYLKHIKPYWRWFVLGITLFFILTTLKNNWDKIAAIQIQSLGWLYLCVALLLNLFAHTWSGWVWSLILRAFQQPVKPLWAVKLYLKTNIYKYLPGNIWHFSGRIGALNKLGITLSIASLSVLLEPLLMAAAALMVALISSCLGLIQTSSNNWILFIEITILISILISIHPIIFNRVIKIVSQLKHQETSILQNYLLAPLLGEIIFLLGRGGAFIFTLMTITSVEITNIPKILSAFSFAWLLGLIVPGAPGGLGVFEASAIALLGTNNFSVGSILAGVALFRLVSILAELIGFIWGTINLSIADER
jgi:hypothetical protein